MKFTELNSEEQAKAIQDYIKGWKEIHPQDIISIQTAKECCTDTNDEINYIIDANGLLTINDED